MVNWIRIVTSAALVLGLLGCSDGPADEGCVDIQGTCLSCVPEVVRIPFDAVPSLPEGTKTGCASDEQGVPSPTCAVVRCGGHETWGLSFNDNREAILVVTFDPEGDVVRDVEVWGLRYVYDATLDAEAETVSFVAQGGRTATLDWSLVRPALDDACRGARLCDGVCRKLDSDPENCGACGYVCEPGVACVDGECVDE